MITKFKEQQRTYWQTEEQNKQYQSDDLIKKQIEIEQRQVQLREYWRHNSKNLETNLYQEDGRIDIEFFQDDDDMTNEILVVERQKRDLPIIIKIYDDDSYSKTITIEDDEQNNAHQTVPSKDVQPIIIESDNDSVILQEPTDIIQIEIEPPIESPILPQISEPDQTNQKIIQNLAPLVVEPDQVQQEFLKDLTRNEKSNGSAQNSSFNSKQAIQEISLLYENSNRSTTETYSNSIIEEEPPTEREEWFALKSAGQVPLSFYSDWKFKEIDSIQVDFSVKHSHLEIFQMLFTPEMATYLIQAIEDEHERKSLEILNAAGWSDPLKITIYDIEAFISLLIHFRCLNRPSQFNSIQPSQTLMDKQTLDWILTNFSMGYEHSSQANSTQDTYTPSEINAISGFLGIVNDRFKQLLNPKEFLTSNTQDLLGLDFRKGDQYILKEFRLCDSEHQFILDIQYDKMTPKEAKLDSNSHRLLEKQSSQLTDYQNKAHKLIILNNQTFDYETIMNLRMISIGVVATVPMQQISFTRKQLNYLKNNQTKNHFFIHQGEVVAAVTPHSVQKARVFISNFIALSSEKDLENPKIQRVYNEFGNEVNNQNQEIWQRHITGVSSLVVVFCRVLDAIITNCFILYNLVYPNQKVQRHQFMSELIVQLQQKYSGFKSLQEKLSVLPTKDIRLHLFKELNIAKKLECLICHQRTKNYCVQCSENSNIHIGFCGQSSCVETHNQTAARILNEKSDASPQRRTASGITNTDRAQESSCEGKKYSKSNSIVSLGRSRIHDGYLSESTHLSSHSQLQSRTFSGLRGNPNQSNLRRVDSRGYLSEENCNNSMSISSLISRKKVSSSKVNSGNEQVRENVVKQNDTITPTIKQSNNQATQNSNNNAAHDSQTNSSPFIVQNNIEIEKFQGGDDGQLSHSKVKMLLFGEGSSTTSRQYNCPKTTDDLRNICSSASQSYRSRSEDNIYKRSRTKPVNKKLTFNMNEEELLELLKPSRMDEEEVSIAIEQVQQPIQSLDIAPSLRNERDISSNQDKSTPIKHISPQKAHLELIQEIKIECLGEEKNPNTVKTIFTNNKQNDISFS